MQPTIPTACLPPPTRVAPLQLSLPSLNKQQPPLLPHPHPHTLRSAPVLHSTPFPAMGDRGDQRLTAQLQHQQLQQRPGEAMKGLLPLPEKAPSASQALTVVTLFPAGGLLLVLSGLALAASVVGVVVAAPVFLLFSPVLVPAALLLALAVAGFLTSGALGLGGLSSLSCLADTLRAIFQNTPDYVDHAKRRMADAASQAGQRTKDAGLTVQPKAHESAGKT